MTRAEISHAVGAINLRYIHEADTYFDRKTYHISLRRIAVLAAILIVILSLCAFTYSYFSTLKVSSSGHFRKYSMKYVKKFVIMYANSKKIYGGAVMRNNVVIIGEDNKINNELYQLLS